ncbi:MAG: hypothetical protein K1X75_06195 [Leptospirales bacterium]|nr:hypothetical protein [Leptospirales bacterium]
MNLRKPIFLFILLCLAAFTLCSKLLGGAIDDATIEKYIRAADGMRAAGAPGGQGGDDAQMEKIAREAGFESLAQFQQTNAKIALAFSVVKARSFIKELEQKKQEGLAEIQQQLARNDLPAETRQQLENSRQTIEREFESNKATAEAVVKATGMFVDDETSASVERHAQRLEQALAGQDLEQFQR